MEFIHDNNRICVKENTGELLAEVTFPEVSPGKVDINRTFVSDTLRGQGIAAKLMEEAYQEIKAQNKKAVPTCSYAVKWFAEHTECKDICE